MTGEMTTPRPSNAEAQTRVHPWVTDRALRSGIVGGPMLDVPDLEAMVLEAENAGYDPYWMPDHPLFTADRATTLARWR